MNFPLLLQAHPPPGLLHKSLSNKRASWLWSMPSEHVSGAALSRGLILLPVSGTELSLAILLPWPRPGAECACPWCSLISVVGSSICESNHVVDQRCLFCTWRVSEFTHWIHVLPPSLTYATRASPFSRTEPWPSSQRNWLGRSAGTGRSALSQPFSATWGCIPALRRKLWSLQGPPMRSMAGASNRAKPQLPSGPKSRC